jgi:hypothetical protein
MTPINRYTFRVKANSELATALDALSNGKQLSPNNISALTNMSRTPWLLRLLGDLFDNVMVDYDRNDPEKKHRLRYTDIMPQQIQVTTSDVNFNGSAAISNDITESKVIWPVAPPITDEIANFDKPTYFDQMEYMVTKKGKHVALEGPPSVGKDTAVLQLAAKHRKPLVTVGGDGGFRRRDLVGSSHMISGTSFTEVGEYVAAVVNGWWVLLTEVNAADPDALIFINNQLAAPYTVSFGGKTYPIHPEFRLFVSYNHGLVGTKPLPQSFKDRFFSIKVPFFTEIQLQRRLEAMGMPEPVISITRQARVDRTSFGDPSDDVANGWTKTVVDFGIAMWKAHDESGSMRYQITTRRLMDAVSLMEIDSMNVKKALKMAVVDAIDSPVDAKAAMTVLNTVVRQGDF